MQRRRQQNDRLPGNDGIYSGLGELALAGRAAVAGLVTAAAAAAAAVVLLLHSCCAAVSAMTLNLAVSFLIGASRHR